MTRADKNMKKLFKEMKKSIEKPPNNVVFPQCTKKVQHALDAERRDTFVTFMYDCYCEAKDVNSSGSFVTIK